VSIEHVLRALTPIWQTKAVAATRVRERVECILAWAAVRAYRASDNPARWDDLLKSWTLLSRTALLTLAVVLLMTWVVAP
jgi:hypothetical protein